MSQERLQEIVARLHASGTALAAVGAALDAKISGVPLNGRIQPHIDDILTTLGCPSSQWEGVRLEELRPVLAELRIYALQNARLLFPLTREPGWVHTEADLLKSAGEVSSGFPITLKRMIVPKLNGLSSRLESGNGKFLDIGVGIGAMAIKMAQLWPELHIVGIDPWEPALALARKHVDQEELRMRIELRCQRAEELPDSNVFDLAWLPSAFVPESVIAMALTRIHCALVPGGWLLFAIVKTGDDPLTAAVARLRVALFGGQVVTTEEAERLLREAGFSDIRMLPSPPSSMVALAAARKPG